MTAKMLRARMDDLPKAPMWKMQDISLDGYRTAKPIVLFYRDPLECIQVLLQNPTFEGKWSFSARRVYNDPDQHNRVYGDWMTSDGAWSAQVSKISIIIDTALIPFTSLLFHQVELFSA
jgi:hypothetical protein